MKGPFKNKQGSTLLEIIVAIAILGLMVAPVCSSLVLSHRLNADSEKTLQARLLVESTVEQLMAEGISFKMDDGNFVYDDEVGYVVANELQPGVSVSTSLIPKDVIDGETGQKTGEYTDQLWFEIDVRCDDVSVITFAKAAKEPTSADAIPEGGGAS